MGTLISGTDGKLYGTTLPWGGDANGAGTIVALDTSNNNFSTILNFWDSNDAAEPIGGLLQASDGLLYGTTSQGGIYPNYGVIFSIDPTTHVYKKLRGS